jgi:hypothetical protein
VRPSCYGVASTGRVISSLACSVRNCPSSRHPRQPDPRRDSTETLTGGTVHALPISVEFVEAIALAGRVESHPVSRCRRRRRLPGHSAEQAAMEAPGLDACARKWRPWASWGPSCATWAACTRGSSPCPLDRLTKPQSCNERATTHGRPGVPAVTSGLPAEHEATSQRSHRHVSQADSVRSSSTRLLRFRRCPVVQQPGRRRGVHHLGGGTV